MLVRLLVLGLLIQSPMSGYEMQGFLQLSRSDQWANVLPGSIYHALKKLASEGMAVLQATEQAGNRSKAIYAITPEGKEEFRRLLRDAWRTPMLHFPSGIYAAMSFLDELPREEAVLLLDEQIEQLEAELLKWDKGVTIKAHYMPEYMRPVFTNGREHIELDMRLLRTMREMIPSIVSVPAHSPPEEEEIS